jgi:YbbR domain-containing protein
MEVLRNIWEGWFYFGDSSTIGQALLVLDVILVAVLTYFALRFLNTRRGFGYLGLVIAALVLLTAAANYNLGGLHLFSRLMLLVLLVGLPIFFEEQWLALFNKEPLVAPPSRPKFLNGFLLGILALFLGLLFVGLNNGPGVRTAVLPEGVRVSAANTAEGISANFGSQKRIQLIIRAPRAVWASLGEEDFSAVADVKSLSEGTHEVAVSVSSRHPEVEIVRASPAKITVTLEPVIRKTVLIVARYSGKAADELVPGEPIFDPDRAEVVGPRSLVQDITQATVQVKLDSHAKDIEQKLSLTALNSSGHLIEDVVFAPAEVAVKIPLVKAGKLKSVGILVKTVGQPAAGYWVESLTVTPPIIAVTGSVDALEKLSNVETDTISISGLSADTELAARLLFPPGIVAAENVDKVTVRLKIGQTSTTKQIVPTISYEGVDPSLKVTAITPTAVNLVISGTSSALADILGGDVLLKLNLSPYKSAGTYAVTIKNEFFTLKEGVSPVSFLPSVINVTLELK